MKNGFTLVELLLTLGVLAVGLISIFTLLPGVSDYSRQLRDRDRMQQFASSVFASLEWSLAESAETDLLSGEEQRTFYNLVGRQSPVLGGSENIWPDTGGVEEWVPGFVYRLELTTNSVSEVEARLTVRPRSSNEEETFTRRIYPKVNAW